MLRADLGQKGFTIVELIIAVVVIGIVGSSITAMFLSIQQAQIGTRYLESATKAAQRQVESLRNSNYSALTPGEQIDFTDQLPEILPGGSTGTVDVSEPSPGLRRVDVNISYNHAGDDQTVELSSLIGIIGITQ